MLTTGTLFLFTAIATCVYAQNMAPHYTNLQADSGKSVYERECLQCHGQDLNGGQFGPALKGDNFRTRWGGKSAGALFIYTATRMPTLAPHSLSNETYLNLVAE